MRGFFHGEIGGQKFEVQNRLVNEGEQSFLKMIWQADVAEVASGGNFYVGLTAATPAETLTLATLASEPTSAGGYARQTATRDAIGWPTISLVNGVYRALSKLLTFTATGVSYDLAIDRFFIASTPDNTGKLYCISGALATPVTVPVGTPLTVQYSFYLD